MVVYDIFGLLNIVISRICSRYCFLDVMLYYCVIMIIVVVIITVTQPLYESRTNWIHGPAPPPPRRTDMDYGDTPVQSSDTPMQSRDTRVKSCDTHVKSCDTHVKSCDTHVKSCDTHANSRDPLCLLVIPRRPPLPHPRK